MKSAYHAILLSTLLLFGCAPDIVYEEPHVLTSTQPLALLVQTVVGDVYPVHTVATTNNYRVRSGDIRNAQSAIAFLHFGGLFVFESELMQHVNGYDVSQTIPLLRPSDALLDHDTLHASLDTYCLDLGGQWNDDAHVCSGITEKQCRERGGVFTDACLFAVLAHGIDGTRAVQRGVSGVAAGIDPHVWMSPKNAIKIVQSTQLFLSEIDSAHASVFKINAKEMIEELVLLRSEYQRELSKCEKKTILVSNNVFAYLGSEYGLQFVGVADVDALDSFIAEHAITHVLVDHNGFESDLQLNVEVVYSMQEESDLTYVERMRANLLAIQVACNSQS